MMKKEVDKQKLCPKCGLALENGQLICPRCWSEKKAKIGPGPISRGVAGQRVVTLDRHLGRPKAVTAMDLSRMRRRSSSVSGL
jgi:hypothetical protein